jgi:hypothetical protein
MSTARGLLIQIGPAVSLSIVIQLIASGFCTEYGHLFAQAGSLTTGFLQHELAQIFREP